ncbi:MAG: DUF6088 family protein [Gammaproteobacteria bacterium]
MKATQEIQKQIKASPAGQLFSVATFHHAASYENTRKILGRLATAGTIKRVARGIYVRPKQVPYVGETLPSPIEIVQMISQSTGEVIAIHGAEAARRLQLTTQVPMQPVFYTTGNTREIKTGNRTIFLQRISPRKLVAPGTIAGTVISALWFLGKSNTTQEVVAKIKQQLSAEEFQQVLNNIAHMPAWMASLFYQYQ